MLRVYKGDICHSNKIKYYASLLRHVSRINTHYNYCHFGKFAFALQAFNKRNKD